MGAVWDGWCGATVRTAFFCQEGQQPIHGAIVGTACMGRAFAMTRNQADQFQML